MKLTIKPVLLLFLLAVAGCKKVIHVDLNDVAPQIVITGDVTNATGPYIVNISKTVNFSESNVFPPVQGAQVTITGTDGTHDNLAETTPGRYATTLSWLGKTGVSYTLTVVTGGQTYTATSTMPPQVPLDSVSFQATTGLGRKLHLQAVPNYQDPAGVSNYYQFTENINGQDYTKKVFASNDRLSDGKYTSRRLDTDTTLQVGDLLLVSMYCIDQGVYNYLSTLNNESDAGNFSSVTPANPTSNINNGALGYFSAHSTQSRQVIVH
ncbi:MAG TPA: DUF4249 domain-containing protein [Chitinophagaceae bacterium]|jgi:hypothetical protein